MSYAHLRNIISGIIDTQESVLDMLIFVLSGMLWQPDYMPRVEIGLPQMSLDAPRLLAHCFLYELDAYLADCAHVDFVRYMDDLDIGVDTLHDAKEALKSVDLVLQTRQIRLNSGKTKILNDAEAAEHFRIFDNALLDNIQFDIDSKRSAGLSISAEQTALLTWLRRGLQNREFDAGNGDKVLRRILGLCARTNSPADAHSLLAILRLRPGIRQAALNLIAHQDLTRLRSAAISSYARSDVLVDDAGLVDVANTLVDTRAPDLTACSRELSQIMSFLPQTVFEFYAVLWLQSKYGSHTEIHETIRRHYGLWQPDYTTGRLVGGMLPLLRGTPEEQNFRELVANSRNHGAQEVVSFHDRLATDGTTFRQMFSFLSAPNRSKATAITHAKFLCLISALINTAAAPRQIQQLVNLNAGAWRDAHYRERVRLRTGVSIPP